MSRAVARALFSSALVLATALVLAAAPLQGKENSITRPEARDGWILLFDGETLFGWSQEGRAKWRIAEGSIVSDGGDFGTLRTNAAFPDYTLKFDFRTSSADADSGVFLRIAKEGQPAETGYQVQLGDGDPKWPSGSIVKLFKSDGSPLTANQWHSVEVELVGDHIRVKMDGRKVTEGKDPKSKAGFIALECNKGPRIDFRNLKLKPMNFNPLFNGTDLAGWKAVGTAPAKPGGGGVFKKLGKVFGGGGPKAKDADWAVQNGMIHVEQGPGQLETLAAYDDFVLQVDVRANAKDKKQHPKTAIFLRGDPGQLFSGYEAVVENATATGGLAGLKLPRKVLGSDNDFLTETIAARGRHFEIWVNGYPVTEFDDTRPEGASTVKAARTAAGAISLQAPDENTDLDFRAIKISALPKILGGEAGKAAVVAPPSVAAVAPPPVLPGAQPVTQQPTLPAVNPNQARDDAKKAKVSKLMTQALKSTDPKEQQQTYEKILALDPDNMPAAQGFKDAQQKIEQENARKQSEQEQTTKQRDAQAANAATLTQALQLGEASFLKGDIPGTQTQLAIAEKVSPNNPVVQSLRSRVDSVVQAKTRVNYLAGCAGVVALLGVIGLVIMASRKKDPYIEVIDGLEKGKRYNLDQEVTHIGAVAQDGGAKNEIVVRDMEQMVSRFHCEIHNKGGKLFLIDRNSSNGTSVDGKRVAAAKPVRIKNGARVQLAGTTALRVGYEKRNKS